MPNQPIQLPWKRPEWQEQVFAWIHAQLVQQNIDITGPIELLHQRPWATFMQVPTNDGPVYFKAPAPMSAYEAAVTQALAQWRPDCNVPVLAVDIDRGWLLSADAGVTIRSLGRTAEQIKHWQKILPLYANLQIELIDRQSTLLALGMEDRRLIHLPRLFNELLEPNENLRIGLEPGLTAEAYQQLLDWRPRFATLCERLADYGIPETIAHEEVHENNVVVRDGRYTFTDWADSSFGHPFFSMVVTLRTFVYWLKLEENGPIYNQLRDIYLEPWTKFASLERLNDAFKLAYVLGVANRAISWHLGTGALPLEDKEAYADTISSWLLDFLEASKSFSIIK